MNCINHWIRLLLLVLMYKIFFGSSALFRPAEQPDHYKDERIYDNIEQGMLVHRKRCFPVLVGWYQDKADPGNIDETDGDATTDHPADLF